MQQTKLDKAIFDVLAVPVDELLRQPNAPTPAQAYGQVLVAIRTITERWSEVEIIQHIAGAYSNYLVKQLTKSQPRQIYLTLTACYNASGEPEIVPVRVECTPQQVSEGDHYEIAEKYLAEDGYDGPFVGMDQQDAGLDSLASMIFNNVHWEETPLVKYLSVQE